MTEINYLLDKISKCANSQEKIINPHFQEWNQIIFDNMTQRKPEDLETIDELIYECTAHAENNRTPQRSENVLVMIHPFYCSISCKNEKLTEMQQLDLKNYNRQLKKVFQLKEELDIDIVMFETPLHYAYSTSILIEKRLVENVYFTMHNSGVILPKTNVRHLKDKNLFFIGGYNTQCLSTAMGQIIMNKVSDKIYSINELVLNPPIEDERLKPKDIRFYYHKREYERLPAENVLRIEEFFEIVRN